MALYIVQHAEAKREEEDPSRPLSPKGKRDAEKIASYLGRLGLRLDKVVHSQKLRAKQTAEILASRLGVREVVEDVNLSPNADPKIWEDRISKETGDIMVVGHLPHLARLTGRLLCNDENRSPIAFQMGGVVCLEKDESGRWVLKWMLIPQLLTTTER